MYVGRFCPDLQAEPIKRKRGSSLRWSPSTVRALPGMCPNRSCGRGLDETASREETYML